MHKVFLVLSVVVASGLVVAPALMQDMPSVPSPYDVVDGWLKPFASSGYSFGSHRLCLPNHQTEFLLPSVARIDYQILCPQAFKDSWDRLA